jgi:hypothetical protein
MFASGKLFVTALYGFVNVTDGLYRFPIAVAVITLSSLFIAGAVVQLQWSYWFLISSATRVDWIRDLIRTDFIVYIAVLL